MLSAITGLIGAYLEAKAIKKVAGDLGTYLDNWARLIASIVITGLVCMLVTWGATGGSLLLAGRGCWFALVSGFLAAMFVTGAIIYQLWTRSPLTKGIPIALPSEFIEKVLQENITITQRS
jgi:uncharacterized membrane protein YdcZ (DUF606 family)